MECLKRNKWIFFWFVYWWFSHQRLFLPVNFMEDSMAVSTEKEDTVADIQNMYFMMTTIQYNGGETQSLGSRLKNTFNYLIPQNWYGHHSAYSHISSEMYSKNQSTESVSWMGIRINWVNFRFMDRIYRFGWFSLGRFAKEG